MLTKSVVLGRFMSVTPLNHPTKFDAASFILAREIRNHTKLQKINSKRYIHTFLAYRDVWITKMSQGSVAQQDHVLQHNQRKTRVLTSCA